MSVLGDAKATHQFWLDWQETVSEPRHYRKLCPIRLRFVSSVNNRSFCAICFPLLSPYPEGAHNPYVNAPTRVFYHPPRRFTALSRDKRSDIHKFPRSWSCEWDRGPERVFADRHFLPVLSIHGGQIVPPRLGRVKFYQYHKLYTLSEYSSSIGVPTQPTERTGTNRGIARFATYEWVRGFLLVSLWWLGVVFMTHLLVSFDRGLLGGLKLPPLVALALSYWVAPWRKMAGGARKTKEFFATR